MKHRLFLLFALSACLFAQTTVNIGTTSTGTVKRVGINLGQNTYYGSQQLLGGPGANGNIFTDGNPGFQNAVFSTIIPCTLYSTTNSSACGTDFGNDWQGGYFGSYVSDLTVLTGPAAQCTSTVTGFNANTSPGSDPAQALLTFTPLTGTSPVTGQNCAAFSTQTSSSGTDMVWVYKPITASNSGSSYTPAEGWGTLTGGSQFYTNVSDAPPGPTAYNNYTNSLQMGTTVDGDVAKITNYADSSVSAVNYRNFYNLNGAYTFDIKTKLVSGATPGIVVTIYRGTPAQTLFTTTITPTSSWVQSSFTFTAAETGVRTGTLYLAIATNGTAQTVELHGARLREVGTNGNTTAFRNGVVSALQSLHPDIIRMWDDATGNTAKLDDMLWDQFKRPPVSSKSYVAYPGYFNTVSYSIPDFLELCKFIGAEPWIVIPVTWSKADISTFIDYLSGPASSTYGAIRIGQGYTSTWTSVLPKIHLELGNEQWNNGFNGDVTAAYNSPAYGTLANQLFQAAKANPNYVPAKMDLILGGQFSGVFYLQQIQNRSNYNDSMDVGPYLYNYVTDYSTPNLWGSLLGEPQTLFAPIGTAVCQDQNNYSWETPNPTTGEGAGVQYECPNEGEYSIAGPSGPYTYQHGGGVMAQLQQAMANTSHPVPLKFYEMGLDGVGDWPATGQTQAQLNSVVPSLGTGLFAAQEVLTSMANGITDMNWFQLGQDYVSGNGGNYLQWGILEDAGGPTNGRRPTYHALSMVNDAINANGALMLATSVTGSPTYNVGTPTASLPYTNGGAINGFAATGIQSVTAHAFQNGPRVGLVLMNLSPTTQPVTFSGANAPTGTVTVTTLASTNISDNNETATTTVFPVTSTVTSPTTYTLPPYSEVEMTWGGTPVCTVSPGVIPNGVVSVAYTVSFGQSNCNTGSWAVTGALPGGLSFDPLTVSIAGTPTAPGSFPITVSYGSASETYTLVVTPAATAAPTISLSSSTLTFASQTVGSTSSSQTVTVNNTGNAPLTISAVTVAGVNGADFSATNNCSSVAVAASCTISVTFTPSVAGSETAILSIADNASGSPHVLTLSGTGQTPSNTGGGASGVIIQTANYTPNLTFSSTAVGGTSAPQNASLYNGSTFTLAVSSISLTGANAADFVLDKRDCYPGAPGDITQPPLSWIKYSGCVMAVSFAPAASGPATRTAQITVVDSASDSPTVATLTGTVYIGTGSAGSVDSLSASSLSFPSTNVGSTSTTQSVTFADGGQGTAISGITITGDFTQTNTCGSTLAAAASCQIIISFTPTAAGARAGQITIRSNASNSPYTVQLSGIGAAIPVSTPNVCTAVNVPSNGKFPAVVNGVEVLDWGIARIQWFSTASSTAPATLQQILYSTQAEWGTAGTYQHAAVFNGAVTSPTQMQGGVLSNLAPSTSYHVTGQSFEAGAWCVSTDHTFTTPAKPIVTPVAAVRRRRYHSSR